MSDLFNFRLFAIGASAGGIEATRELLSQLPAEFPAPILVVIHVPADSSGKLDSVLQRSSKMVVQTAVDGTRLLPGHVYVARPNFHLVVNDSHMRLLSGPRENRHRPAIDPLFRSAARAYGPNATGILLSGYLDDGVAGLFRIKEAGGVAIVQDPDDAIVPDMPSSAIERVEPQYTVRINEMAALMVQLAGQVMTNVRRSEMPDREMDGCESPGVPSVFTCPECHGTLWETTEDDTLKFRCRVGHAFTADTVVEEQSQDVERALWAALRVLEENTELCSRLASRSRRSGHDFAVKRYELRAEESRENAMVIRRLLTSEPQVPRPARPLECVEEEQKAGD